MTIGVKLRQLEDRVAHLQNADEMTVVIIRQWTPDPAAPFVGPPEEVVQERIAEARAAGQSFVAILWPETLEAEAQANGP